MNSIAVDALLFDLGGVVLEVNFEKVFEHWAKTSNLAIGQIKEQFAMDEAYQLHEKGLISGTQYFAHLRSSLNLTADDVALTAGWNAIFGNEINLALDAIDQVRDRYRCYGFTNTNAIHQEYWEREHPRIRQSFDRVFVSSEMGLRKPDLQAFEYILKETSTRADAMLFFDDTNENIKGALVAGLQAIQVNSAADVIDALHALR
ncbi:MAG: epoxide hydrolase-like predicted phosphatase [Granulosicoccus sp.]|jgi:epoxide hydrolase-like predicted phosphatase